MGDVSLNDPDAPERAVTVELSSAALPPQEVLAAVTAATEIAASLDRQGLHVSFSDGPGAHAELRSHAGTVMYRLSPRDVLALAEGQPLHSAPTASDADADLG